MFSTLITAFVPAQEHGKPAGEKPAAEKPAPAKPAPVFVIAKHGDKHDVMSKEEFDTKNKQMAEEFAKAKQQYEKDKAAADAAHKKFEGKEPKLHALEAVGGEFASKDAAEAAVKKMEDKGKEKDKGDKPKDKGDKAKEPKKGGTDKPKHLRR